MPKNLPEQQAGTNTQCVRMPLISRDCIRTTFLVSSGPCDVEEIFELAITST